MFSGIISNVGVVRRSLLSGPDLKLVVDVGAACRDETGVGDSVAVDGVCLTVTGIEGNELSFDVSAESLARTLLSGKSPGDVVNIELALLPTTRLGGHIVTGHVDGIGWLDQMEPIGASTRLRFRVPAELSPFIAPKGSVCIDGISLTVNSVSGDSFEVNIVPHTAQVTTVRNYEPGRRVHLEVDIIARYLARLVATGFASSASAGAETLRDRNAATTGSADPGSDE